MDVIGDFLKNPDGKRYDLLIAYFNQVGAEQVLSTLPQHTRNLLLKGGKRAFGREELFYQWLWTTLPGGNVKPIDLIGAGEAIEVIQLLGRIEHTVSS